MPASDASRSLSGFALSVLIKVRFVLRASQRYLSQSTRPELSSCRNTWLPAFLYPSARLRGVCRERAADLHKDPWLMLVSLLLSFVASLSPAA